MYKLLIQKKSVNEKGIFEDLNSDIILEDFLEYYYKKIIFDDNLETLIEDSDSKEVTNVKVNIEEIEEIEEVETLSDNNELAYEEASCTEIEQVDLSFKKIDNKRKKICYYTNDVTKKEEENSKLREVLIKYIKYNKKVNVVDKDTLEKKYEKAKNQGDLEKQHYLIKTSNSNKALLIWEKILGAVTVCMFEKNINSEFRLWIKEEFKNDKEKKLELLQYHIKIYSIPSKKFLEEIECLDKISLLQVEVEKEKLTGDEDIKFSEENISRDVVDIIYKPINGLSFSKSKVKKYVKNNMRKVEVKKIIIQGKKEGNPIRLDTEFMKVSEYVEIKEDSNGLIDSKDIFDELKKFIERDEDIFLNNIYIEQEDDDE